MGRIRQVGLAGALATSAVAGDDTPACGRDRTFTTTATGASVTGSGTMSQRIAAVTVSVEAFSGGDGSGVVGEVERSFPFHDLEPQEGSVTCLRVEGNLAAIGYRTVVEVQGEPEESFRVVFIEDTGPTGDGLTDHPNDSPGTTCPMPTHEIMLGGHRLFSGDYVVRSTGGGT